MPFVASDDASVLVVTCKNYSDDSIIDLTGSTVALRWRDASGTLVSRNMTITNAASGIAQYQFAADELFAPRMSFEVRITDSGGALLHSIDLIDEPVRARLS